MCKIRLRFLSLCWKLHCFEISRDVKSIAKSIEFIRNTSRKIIQRLIWANRRLFNSVKALSGVLDYTANNVLSIRTQRWNFYIDFFLIFSCRTSNKTDAITFTFYAEELFLSVKTQLLNQYNSNLNKNENGLETFILERIKRP